MPLITKLTMELIKMRLGDEKVVDGDPSMDALVSTVDEVSYPPSRTLTNMKMCKSQRPVIPEALCRHASKSVDQVDRGSTSFNKRPQPIVGTSKVGLHHPSHITIYIRHPEPRAQSSNS